MPSRYVFDCNEVSCSVVGFGRGNGILCLRREARTSIRRLGLRDKRQLQSLVLTLQDRLNRLTLRRRFRLVSPFTYTSFKELFHRLVLLSNLNIVKERVTLRILNV